MYMSSLGFRPNDRSWPHGGCHLTPWEWICGCSRIIQSAQPGVPSLRSDAGQPVAWWQKPVYHGASYSPPSGRSHRRNNPTLSSAPLPVRSEGADRFQHVREPSFALPQYDFGRAILPWTNFWIERFRLTRHCGPGSHHGLRFLYISYAFGNHEAFSKCYADFIFKSDLDGIVDLRPKHGGPPDKHGCCPWCRGPRPSADVDKLTRETGTALLPDGLLGIIPASLKDMKNTSTDWFLQPPSTITARRNCHFYMKVSKELLPNASPSIRLVRIIAELLTAVTTDQK